MTNFNSKVITLCICFFIFSNDSFTQKKFDYGIGFGLSSSKLVFNNTGLDNQNGFREYIGFKNHVRIEYNLAKNRITLDPGFHFYGTKTVEFDMNNPKESSIEFVGFQFPLSYNQYIFEGISLIAGVSYEYIVKSSFRRGDQTENLNTGLSNRNIFSGHLGLTTNIKNWVDIQLIHSRSFNGLFDFVLSDANGNVVGTIPSYNRMTTVSFIIAH